MGDPLDDELCRRARAARSETESHLDVDADLAALSARPFSAGSDRLLRTRRYRTGPAAIAAAGVLVAGGFVLLGRDPQIETVAPAPVGSTVSPTLTPDTGRSDADTSGTSQATAAATGTTPIVPTPNVTTPNVTTPNVSTPAVTTPGATTPAATTPVATTPTVTAPSSTAAPPNTGTAAVAPSVTAADAGDGTDLTSVSWRSLPWEVSPIAHACTTGLGCTRAIVGPDGSVVTYDPDERTIARHAVPSVELELPDRYGDTSVAALGPGDVVYLSADSEDRALGVDVIALVLTPGDAGRELGRWVGVTGRSADSVLVPTRHGLVVVGSSDGVPPAGDAPIAVPWVDADGDQIDLLHAALRIEIDVPTLRVARDGVFEVGGRTWTVHLGKTSGGIPTAMPTFDGGFIAATSDPGGLSVTRGWADGTSERTLLSDASDVALDPSGRVLVPDGERFARIDPFPGRTWIWAGRPEVDLPTGSVTLPGIDELAESNDWGRDPIAFADVVAGPVAVNELRTIDLERVSDDTFLATVTTSNLFDDSISAVRYELTLTSGERGRFRFESGRWAQACQPNRGHQDFRAELCR